MVTMLCIIGRSDGPIINLENCDQFQTLSITFISDHLSLFPVSLTIFNTILSIYQNSLSFQLFLNICELMEQIFKTIRNKTHEKLFFLFGNKIKCQVKFLYFEAGVIWVYVSLCATGLL